MTEKEFLSKGKKLDVICLPDEELKLPDYFIPDTKLMYKFVWQDRSEQLLKPIMETKEKIRKIYEVLPKLNCGFCGYGNCGQYARAVAEGRTSPNLCIGGSWVAYKISEITGIKMPASAYGFYGKPSAGKSGITVSSISLKEELKDLNRRADDILDRIENLRGRRGD